LEILGRAFEQRNALVELVEADDVRRGGGREGSAGQSIAAEEDVGAIDRSLAGQLLTGLGSRLRDFLDGGRSTSVKAVRESFCDICTARPYSSGSMLAWNA